MLSSLLSCEPMSGTFTSARYEMRTNLPQPRTIVIVMSTSVIVAAIFGRSSDLLRLGLVALFVLAVDLLIIAALEWRNLRPRPVPPDMIAVSVTRSDGSREVISLNPDNDESVENFTRALQEDIALRTTPEERETLRTYAHAKVDRDLANVRRA